MPGWGACPQLQTPSLWHALSLALFMRLFACVFIYFINFFSQESLCRAVGKGDWGVALRSTAEILFCFTDPDLEEEELFKDA